MMRRVLAVALAAVATVAVPAAQSDVPTPIKFTAFAVDTSTMTTRARTSTVDLVINKWSPDADRDRLLKVFRDKGQDALLSELQKLPTVGYISTPGSLRYDLHFARQRAEPEGGHMIFLMTDRYINAWEARNQPRTVDYPFMLIQLHVDKNGHGEGKASTYTRITETKNGTIELENFANQPVALNEVTMVK
jgi:hypothetical protein